MTGGRQHNHCLQEWSFLITTVLAYVDISLTQLPIFDTHLNLGGSEMIPSLNNMLLKL